MGNFISANIRAQGRYKMNLFLSIFILLLVSTNGNCANLRNHLVANSTARVQSMGGCFAANSSFSDAHCYNPAALSSGQFSGWMILCDPLSPAISRTIDANEEDSYADFLEAALFIRGLYIGNEYFRLGLLPAEHRPVSSAELSETLAESTFSQNDLQPGLVCSVKLDDKVSLGLSIANVFIDEGAVRKTSVSYGVLIKTNNWLDVGITSFYLPTGVVDSRKTLERIGNKTVNVGILYYITGRNANFHKRAPYTVYPGSFMDNLDLRMALDVRNVTQNSGLNDTQEIHLGFVAALNGSFELQSGIYWPSSETGHSAKPRIGIGIGFEQPLFFRKSLRTAGYPGMMFNISQATDPESEQRNIISWSLKWAF
jgi:hypothetical protein